MALNNSYIQRILPFGIDIIDKTLRVNDLLHKGWEGLSLEGPAGSLVGDNTAVEINADNVSGADILCSFIAFYNGKSDVYGISVEYSGKAFCDHAADT